MRSIYQYILLHSIFDANFCVIFIMRTIILSRGHVKSEQTIDASWKPVWTLSVTSVYRTHSVLHISVTSVIWELLKQCVGTAKAKQPRLHHRLPREGEFTGKKQRRQGHFFNQCDAYHCDCALLHSFISISYLLYL